MRVRVLAFARLRELLGGPVHEIEVPDRSTAGDVWNALEDRAPIGALRQSTRLACNGSIVTDREGLDEGDELALLPPVGGG